MKRLYNEYLALNRDGQSLDSAAQPLVDNLLAICKERDLDLRDAESVLMSAINVSFCEAILTKAFKIKKAQQEKG